MIYPILQHSKLFFQLMVGATILAFIRNVVGVRTFGVFAPVIVSFVFLRAGLIWGLFLFVNIFLISLVARAVFEPLKLSTSNRIAITLTIVGIYMSLIEMVGEAYHIKELEFSILFPILITSWLGDRFANEKNERGWYYPTSKLFWTTLAVVVAYLSISYEPLIFFIIANPETWSLLILINIYLGIRVKFRLTEHLRFRKISNPEKDILTLNTRNRDFVGKYNPRNIFPEIEKAKLKEKLQRAGVPVAQEIFVVKNKKDLETCKQILSNKHSFVIKPSKSYGGEGILIIKGKNESEYLSSNGYSLDLDHILNHISQILDGQYSTDQSDTVLIEELITPDPFFERISYSGLPDIRVIVLKGFPIMTMMRLPTKQSNGKANLHMGAVIVGIDLATGITKKALYFGKNIEKHPDTTEQLLGFEIKDWTTILEIGAKAQVTSGLGYAGVDIAVDRKRGPLVLEVNKRPGLEIQNANADGLLRRLKFVETKLSKYENYEPTQKVELSIKWDQQKWRSEK
ncbi:MAG: alpha-L-glutamate ligase-like protein [Promethearchaeota archaeon]